MLPLLLLLTIGQPEAAPADTSLDQALTMIRPHLQWHAPAAPPDQRERIREVLEQKRELRDASDPWQPALGPLPTWEGDIPKALVEQTERLARAHPERPEVPPLSSYPWRLKDPGHADIVKALALLDSVKEGPSQAAAQRWAAEIRRNNTVLTLDVAGAFPTRKRARVVLDVRNAERVRISLHRIGSAEDLLRVMDRIGRDFVFLSHDFDRRRERQKQAQRDVMKEREAEEKLPLLPEVLREPPLASWEQPLEKLRRIPHDDLRHPFSLDDFDDDEVSHHDDSCHRFRRRLEREYLPSEREFSSWRAGLILDIPGEHLREPGAYLLRVEANGQIVLAPMLVDPPALTLRRCPDGVLAVVGTPGGHKPLEGATVQARSQQAAVRTDAGGVTFLHAYARGDRAIVVEHQGRFAVGGFGAVFAGIYRTPDDPPQMLREGKDRVGRIQPTREGHVYADGVVVALWCDRPAYRPGEEVQAKVIVRRRVRDPRQGVFRADEYEPARLELLPVGTPLTWQLVDADGNSLGKGDGKLNDFGTLATTFHLPATSTLGSCRLGVTVNDRPRLLPDVFVVDPLHRVPAEIQLSDLPATLAPGSKLPLTCTVQQTGLPITGGTLTLALVNGTTRWNLTPDPLKLDHQGTVRATLVLPLHLPAETMTLRAHVTDAQGLTTTRAFPVTIVGNATPMLGRLPRFVGADQELTWATQATEIELEQGREIEGTPTFKRTRLAVRQGQARLRFPTPGWYTVRTGSEEQEVFVHGGTEPPHATFTRRQLRNEAEGDRWVDLAHYRGPFGNESTRGDNRPPLLALFDQQEGEVGETLKVLVYVPYDSARLLLTCEAHSILDYHLVHVDGKAVHYHEIRLPLRARHRPHFYLQGTILAARGPGQALERRVIKELEELKRLDDDPGEEALWCKVVVRGPLPQGEIRVTVQPDRPAYELGEPVTIDVKTVDTAGKPVVTELALSVVEERLYGLSGDRNPVILATFLGTRGADRYQRKTWRHSLGINPEQERIRRMQDQAREMSKAAHAQLAHLDRELLHPRAPLAPRDELGELPIAVVPLSPPRSPAPSTAFAIPILRTDGEGKARVTFKATTTLTRYRINALALSRDGHVGLGQGTLRIGKPLEVEVFLPEQVPTGMVLRVPVQIRNHTPRERRVQVNATIQGLTVPVGAVRDWVVRVPAGGVISVVQKVEAARVGPVSVRAQISDEIHDDAETRRSDAVLPMPLPRPEGTVPPPGM